MAIAAQQAPIGSMAHALYEQNQLAKMLEASLSHMTPIQFGFGGYVRKSYPTYGPLMLSLTSLKPDDRINKSAQHALLPKAESKPLENSGPRPTKTYSVYDGEPVSTFESRHRVLGGKNPSKLDGFASTAILGYSLVEDFVTLVDPNATPEEYMEAALSAFNPVGKAKKVKNAIDTIEGMDTAANLV